MDRQSSSWAEEICNLPVAFRFGRESIRQLFEPARAHLAERDAFLAAVAKRLHEQPDLIDAWQGYSEDKRGTGPFLRLSTLEVGVYEAYAGLHDVHHFANRVDACAEFIYREACSVLRRAT
jgi:hypothetical protein